MIMEAFKCDLFELVTQLRKDLGLSSVALLFCSIVRSVQFIHLRYHAHGDLVPYNILLDMQLSPIISDLSCCMVEYNETHFEQQSFRGSTHARPPEIRHVKTTKGMKGFDAY